VHRQTADDLLAVGPGAPSGLAGWSAADLAAHLMSQTGAARHALAAGRLALTRNLRLGDRAGPATNARAIRLYQRRGFTRAIEAVRKGPPWPLLAPAIAPVALFEIWVHGDDLRRGNGLPPGIEPASLAEAVDFLARYQQPILGDTAIDRTQSDADLVRWLVGRPSALPPHDPSLTI